MAESFGSLIENSEKCEESIYIFTGKEVWPKLFLDMVKKSQNLNHVAFNTKFKKNFRDIQFPGLMQRKHLVYIEALKDFSNADFDELINYIKKPSKHAIVIISIKEWATKRKLMFKFRNIKKAKGLKFYELDYPKRDFVKGYMNYLIRENEIVFENNKTKELLFKRIVNNPDTILDNILTLKAVSKNGEIKVSQEMVKNYVEEETTSSYDKLFKMCAEVNRVRAPYESYQNLLESGVKHTTIMIHLRTRFLYLMQAKMLLVKGLIIHNDIIHIRRGLFKSKGVEMPNDVDIWSLPDFKINYYLDLARNISVKEIVFCINCLNRYWVDKGDGKFTMRANEHEAFDTLLKILNRRVEKAN